MSDPTTPAGGPTPPAGDTQPPVADERPTAVPADQDTKPDTPPVAAPDPAPAPAPGPAPAPAAGPAAASAPQAAEAKPADGKVAKVRRSPWLTVVTIVAVLALLAGLGYFAGLGPMSRLSATRAITPPDTLGGLSRITDPTTRDSLKLDDTRDTLSRANDGKRVAVELYGDPSGDRLFIVIALRGKVDLDKLVKDDGATADQVKKVGGSTCVPNADNLLPRCYRTSNTLTVIGQDATNKLTVDAVGPVTNDAFAALK